MAGWLSTCVFIRSLYFSPVFFINAQAHICEVGREKDGTNAWMWTLPYPDPCLCSQVIMGGMNTWTPIRLFKPTYVYSPLISDDVKKIRTHYNLKCEEEGMTVSGRHTTFFCLFYFKKVTVKVCNKKRENQYLLLLINTYYIRGLYLHDLWYVPLRTCDIIIIMPFQNTL